MTDPLTAADYVYLDRAETRYMEVKEFIQGHRDWWPHPENRKRPGIPGTIVKLNDRVQLLCVGKQFSMAAAAIESKVRWAYKVKASTP